MTFDATAYGMVIPEKVRWRLEPIGVLADVFRSQSLRKTYRNLDERLVSHNLTHTYSQISEQEFLTWLAFYKKRIEVRGFWQATDESWYQKKMAEGKTVEMIALWHEGRMVSGGIIPRKGNEMMMLAFSAHDHEFGARHGVSLGTILTLLFFRYATTQAVEVISGGASHNIFGGATNLRLGYLEFKLKLGYNVYPKKDTKWEQVIELPEDELVFTFGKEEESEKLTLCAIHPQGTAVPDAITKILEHPVNFGFKDIEV